MNLKLSRPIVFFDLETTGVDLSNNKIVEISMIKLLPGGDRDTMTRRINPGIPIPEEASSVHGIYNADVADKPTFAEIAPKIHSYMKDCDIAGFNSDHFDLPFLAEELARCGIILNPEEFKTIDVFSIYSKKEKRTLSAAYTFYCDKNLEDAHSAEADTLATLEVFLKQIEKYEDIGNTVEDISNYSRDGKELVDLGGKFYKNDTGQLCFNFGKNKNQPLWQNIHYLHWMLKADFPKITKDFINNYLEGLS